MKKCKVYEYKCYDCQITWSSEDEESQECERCGKTLSGVKIIRKRAKLGILGAICFILVITTFFMATFLRIVHFGWSAGIFISLFILFSLTLR